MRRHGQVVVDAHHAVVLLRIGRCDHGRLLAVVRHRSRHRLPPAGGEALPEGCGLFSSDERAPSLGAEALPSTVLEGATGGAESGIAGWAGVAAAPSLM